MDTGEIDGEVVRLKNELSKTKKALTNQIFERHRLAAELSLKVDRRTSQLKDFQRSNFQDLGRVLRSLYVFESRLRKEQQQIRRELGERDSLIRRQQVEIAKLRQTLVSRCRANDAREEDAATAIPASKPDLITSISPRPTNCVENVAARNDDADSSRGERRAVLPPPKPDGTRTIALAAGERVARKNAATSNNINFNKNVYNSKTVTDLSLNDISSFPNPTPNNNLFVVSNSIFSKNEFAYDGVSKEATTSVKQNGKVITSALKKPDKYPSSKSVHFGKTTHIPEPDEDGQTDIVKTVETLLLQQCGDSTESENDTSSTASAETSPSVSQMVRKFESICTTTVAAATAVVAADSRGSPSASSSPASSRSSSSSSPVQRDCTEPRRRPNRGRYPKNRGNGSSSCYIAVDELKTAAELLTADDELSEDPCDGGTAAVSPGDLDHPRNNFEEFRFEDSDLLDRDDEEYCRADGDGLERRRRPDASPSGDCAADPGGGAPINYESFLEVTGLSQKSIITVQSSNRNLYGSHRNVQKPKDVKSRSRAKSVSFEYKPYQSTVKYWTEPYL